jgi:hypothetical protein
VLLKVEIASKFNPSYISEDHDSDIKMLRFNFYFEGCIGIAIPSLL